MVTFQVPTIGPATNKFYSGMHIQVRRRLAKQWHSDIAWLVKEQNIKPLSEEYYPATVQVYGIFGPKRRMFDADGLAATGKLIIDGLVRAGILVNDSLKYIRNVEYIPQKGAETQTIVRIYYDDQYNTTHMNYKLTTREGLLQLAESIRRS